MQGVNILMKQQANNKTQNRHLGVFFSINRMCHALNNFFLSLVKMKICRNSLTLIYEQKERKDLYFELSLFFI